MFVCMYVCIHTSTHKEIYIYILLGFHVILKIICDTNAIALPVVGVLLITVADMERGPLDGGTEPAYPKCYFGSAFGITTIRITWAPGAVYFNAGTTIYKL